MGSKEKGCFLLIHGFTGTRREMEPLSLILQQLGYKTELLKLPGHESTPEDLRKIKWTEWIDYVQEELEKAKDVHDNVFISGLSLGGALSLYIAAKNPDIAGIIPISAPYTFPDKKIIFIRLFPFLKRIVTKIQSHEKGWEDLEALSKHRSYNYFYIESVMQVYWFLKDLKNVLPLVEVPTLIIHAKKDPAVPLWHAKKIFSSINSREKDLKIIEKGAHVVTEDAGKEQAFQYIKEWLKGREK